jgi:hypothetical protein
VRIAENATMGNVNSHAHQLKINYVFNNLFLWSFEIQYSRKVVEKLSIKSYIVSTQVDHQVNENKSLSILINLLSCGPVYKIKVHTTNIVIIQWQIFWLKSEF